MITSAVKQVSLTDFRNAKNVAGVEVWNVLTDEYFKGEMIPGTRRVKLDEVGDEVRKGTLAKDAAIITYCGGPKCPQSKLAAEKLQHLGFTNVSAYEGGVQEWKEAGLPIQQT